MSEGTGTHPEPKRHEPYHDVRERLVTLGYLQRPLDRYVLGGLVRQGSFLARHALVSAKVALAAAPLLGLLFAIAVAWVFRPRFSRPGEFAWLALDFTVVFGAGIFVLEWLAGLLIAALVWWRGRGVPASHATAARAGFAVSLLVSAYLAYWWRRRVGGSGGLLLDALGLLVLVVVNAALYRVSSLASLAALIRVSDLPSVPRSTRFQMPMVTAAAAVLLVLVLLVAPVSRRETPAPDFTRIPVEGRIVVVAWDGVPLGLYEKTRGSPDPRARTRLIPMREAPEGRALSRPAFWTEIATGRRAVDHGVHEISDRQLIGLSSPLSSDVPLRVVLETLLPRRRVAVSAGLRTSLTVWEILAEREGVGVAGWWATWPAIDRGTEERPFAVVSDRAILSLQVPSPHDHRIVPESLARELNVHFHEDLAEARARLGPSASRDAAADTGPGEGLDGDAQGQAPLIDGWTCRVTERLLDDPHIKSLFVYLPGLDILTAHPEMVPSREGVEAHAGYVMESIDRLRRSLQPQDWLLILGDPGRAGDQVHAGAPSGSALPENGGWVEISGPGVDPQGPASSWSPLDVAPTILNLRGFPASQDMPGSARVDFLAAEWRDRLLPHKIPTYGENAVPALTLETAASEEDILERLRSLGYLN